jgi:chromosome segregation ATPase
MYVLYYLQKEQTKEKQEPFFGRLGLKKRKVKYYFTHKNDENDEDCGEAKVDILSTTSSSYGSPSCTQEVGYDLRDYPKQVREPPAEGSKLWTKLRSRYRQSRKEDNQLYGTFEALKGNLFILTGNIERTEEKMKALDLDIEKFLEQCKEAELLGKQSNVLAEKGDELRRNKDSVLYGAECLLEEAEGTRKSTDDLNFKAENVREQCKVVGTLEKQLKFVTVERDQLIEDQEAVMHEVECLSEAMEMTRKDMDDLKLKVENIRDQCKEEEKILKEMKTVKAEGDELRRNNDAVINERKRSSEETEITRKNMDDIREECNDAEVPQMQLNLVTEQGDQLREKDKEACIYAEAKSSSKKAEKKREDIDVLILPNVGRIQTV